MPAVYDVTAKDVSKRVCNLINVVSLPPKAISTFLDHVVFATLELHGSVSENISSLLANLAASSFGRVMWARRTVHCGTLHPNIPEHVGLPYRVSGPGARDQRLSAS